MKGIEIINMSREIGELENNHKFLLNGPSPISVDFLLFGRIECNLKMHVKSFNEEDVAKEIESIIVIGMRENVWP